MLAPFAYRALALAVEAVEVRGLLSGGPGCAEPSGVCRTPPGRTPAVCEGIPRGRANGAGMSATGGIVRMPSHAESAAGGNVVPLRTESPPVDQTQPEPAAALGPVSPELALVDPELRQAARELLPDPPRPAPSRALRSSLRPASSRRSRSSHRLAAAADSVCSRQLPASSRSASCSRWLSVARSDPSDGRRRLNRSQPPSHQRPLRSRSQSPLRPRLPAPRRRRRPPRQFTRPRFGDRRSSGSLPRTRRHTSSSCSRAASASSGRASTKRDSSFRVAGGWQAALTRCCRGATAGTSGRSPRAQIASRRSRR